MDKVKLIEIRISFLILATTILFTSCHTDWEPDSHEGEYYYDNPACPVSFWFNLKRSADEYLIDGAQVNYYLLNNGMGVSPDVSLEVPLGSQGQTMPFN